MLEFHKATRQVPAHTVCSTMWFFFSEVILAPSRGSKPGNGIATQFRTRAFAAFGCCRWPRFVTTRSIFCSITSRQITSPIRPISRYKLNSRPQPSFSSSQTGDILLKLEFFFHRPARSRDRDPVTKLNLLSARGRAHYLLQELRDYFVPGDRTRQLMKTGKLREFLWMRISPHRVRGIM